MNDGACSCYFYVTFLSCVHPSTLSIILQFFLFLSFFHVQVLVQCTISCYIVDLSQVKNDRNEIQLEKKITTKSRQVSTGEKNVKKKERDEMNE